LRRRFAISSPGESGGDGGSSTVTTEPCRGTGAPAGTFGCCRRRRRCRSSLRFFACPTRLAP
jgi:hypothetical protein